MVVLIYWSQEACLWVTDKKIDAEFLLVTVIDDLHFLKHQIKCCRRDRLPYQPSSAAPQPSGLHPNDILVNIKLSPYTYPGMVVGGLSTWKLGSPSMYDLLQEFQSLTNAHRKDCQLFTLHFALFWVVMKTCNHLSMMGCRFGRLCSIHTPPLAFIIPNIFWGWIQRFKVEKVTRISGMPDEIVILCKNREVCLHKLPNVVWSFIGVGAVSVHGGDSNIWKNGCIHHFWAWTWSCPFGHMICATKFIFLMMDLLPSYGEFWS